MQCQDEAQKGPLTALHYGGWFPKNPALIDRFVKRVLTRVYKTTDRYKCASVEKKKRQEEETEDSSITEFRQLIETDPEIYKYFNLMFTEVPLAYRTIEDYNTLLALLNHCIQSAPMFYNAELVGVPMAAILLRPMLTVSGSHAFLNDKVNAAMKKVLNRWYIVCKSSASREVLNEGPYGWLGEDAMAQMPGFKDLYECDPSQPYWGYASWDAFFVRPFLPGVRPIAAGDNIICNAAESTPLAARRNVQLRDDFWIKEMPYGMEFLLANDPLVSNYVGGTVYQAFLAQFFYHRWHSPVDGKILKAYNVDGTYFAECLREGYHSLTIAYSQCYLANTAAKALIFIQADNPHIGTVVFVGIGMTEISSCEITTYEGAIVKKGDEIGMFHYGGSSHCLVFERGVDVKFVVEPATPDEGMQGDILDINAKVGEVFY